MDILARPGSTIGTSDAPPDDAPIVHVAPPCHQSAGRGLSTPAQRRPLRATPPVRHSDQSAEWIASCASKILWREHTSRSRQRSSSGEGHPALSALRDDRRRDAAATQAGSPHGARRWVDATRSARHRSFGAHGRGRRRSATGAAATTARARTVEDARLTGVAAHLELVAVVNHNLEPIRVTCRQ